MQKAAKEKILFLLAIASALFVCAPAIASSTHHSTAENRVELFLLEAQNRTGGHALGPANRVENYDPSWEVALESSVAPNPGSVSLSAGKRIPGDIVQQGVIERLETRLNRNGVQLRQDADAIALLDNKGAAAGFAVSRDGQRAQLLLRPDATRFEIVHELRHYQHWLENRSAFRGLTTLEKESRVFRDMTNHRLWNLGREGSSHPRAFTSAERSSATRYIQRVEADAPFEAARRLRQELEQRARNR